MSAMLIREEDKVQKPVYYVRKVLIGAETRYLKIEKLTYVFLIVARKLRHYFQAHPTTIFKLTYVFLIVSNDLITWDDYSDGLLS